VAPKNRIGSSNRQHVMEAFGYGYTCAWDAASASLDLTRQNSPRPWKSAHRGNRFGSRAAKTSARRRTCKRPSQGKGFTPGLGVLSAIRLRRWAASRACATYEYRLLLYSVCWQADSEEILGRPLREDRIVVSAGVEFVGCA
jgi:hypothetical protein